ncbi:MAG TPA: hypothetical protein VFJ17_00540 [Mycobacteriales bacterium]|jgi:hypothetical protein|nr:hypothetical protein [Mycobacteriales bacterium]
MTHTQTSQAHPANHPLFRAAGIDLAALAFVGGAAVLTLFLGNGSAQWVNGLVSATVWVLALIAVALLGGELRQLWRNGPDEKHLGSSAAAVVVVVALMCVVVPMVLIMPFMFLGAL